MVLVFAFTVLRCRQESSRTHVLIHLTSVTYCDQDYRIELPLAREAGCSLKLAALLSGHVPGLELPCDAVTLAKIVLLASPA
jgi:hypothetical protein